MLLGDFMKEDFIESLTVYNECDEATGKDIWEMFGEEYVDAVFQDMADRMVEISNKMNKER